MVPPVMSRSTPLMTPNLLSCVERGKQRPARPPDAA
jgi:hypothetical protein